MSGTIRKEDTLEMYPIGKECKIRSIQVHGQDKKSVMRDNVWQLICLMLRKKKFSEAVCWHRRQVWKYRPAGCEDEYTGLLYAGIDESYEITSVYRNEWNLCRAVLLDKEEIGPGESGYVQLRLEDEIAVAEAISL